jgi:hypothetical protein
MASGGNEHRMVFDIRGKRRHVVKFVYGILALLMGASLFLVVGPVNIASLFETGNKVSAATSQFEEQAQRFEHKLIKSPEDPELLLGLTKARINAGNSAVEQTSTGELVPTVESTQQLQKASAAWSEYLEATDEPSSGAAQLVANALFTLAQTSSSTPEAEANIKAAAEAQKIVADARPSLNALSTYALYTLYTFNYAAAEKANAEAAKLTTSKLQREELEKNFEAVKKRAHEFQKGVAEAAKAAKQGAKQGATPESLANPFSGLGSSSLSE